MSYGVNQWAGQRGRARRAGSSKRKSTRTAKRKRSVSARRVRKKKTKRRPIKPRKAPRAARGSKRAKKAKKARLYTRYDPTTGQKVRVTVDTFEYRDWPSRKPSKKKLAREAFKSDPLGTTGSLAQQAAKRAIERAGEQTVTRVLRAARTAVLPAAAAAGPVAASAAILAAAYLVGDRIARDQRVKLGDRLNTISLRFKETQRQLIAAFGTRWEDVPADLRARAVRDYKSAIATATSRAQGSAFAGVRAEGSYK